MPAGGPPRQPSLTTAGCQRRDLIENPQMHRRQFLTMLPAAAVSLRAQVAAPRTTVAIATDRFLINGRPTYEGRTGAARASKGC
jgi:hypothetical protein